ncbi:MAG: WecB/TagA/CpsF family glycosyltransferase [Candidatus Omnitrophica bacterium]|nr:WecB/TagA/CpsF family glycosyltransferase [Candidatus Omnitrophota bacterium]MDE2223296.1 WecB/TagA/CpsF family glycosyltransferase [Candidatus Omnitrophota bacterium]
MEETLEKIEDLVVTGGPAYLGSVNVDMIVRCHHDSDFARYYQNCHLCLTDGVPVLWASKFLGTPLKEKVAGSDLVPRICALANARGYKIFFLGGRTGAAAAAKVKLLKDFPHLKIVGTYAPPYGFEKDLQELRRIEAMVREAGPDILLVGLGAPKQEIWISRYYEDLGVPVMMGVGVTFEFIAGIVKRAPRWMQQSGLEWLWRLLMEPQRLWKRYLVDDLKFFGLVLKQKFIGRYPNKNFFNASAPS